MPLHSCVSTVIDLTEDVQRPIGHRFRRLNSRRPQIRLSCVYHAMIEHIDLLDRSLSSSFSAILEVTCEMLAMSIDEDTTTHLLKTCLFDSATIGHGSELHDALGIDMFPLFLYPEVQFTELSCDIVAEWLGTCASSI